MSSFIIFERLNICLSVNVTSCIFFNIWQMYFLYWAAFYLKWSVSNTKTTLKNTLMSRVLNSNRKWKFKISRGKRGIAERGKFIASMASATAPALRGSGGPMRAYRRRWFSRSPPQLRLAGRPCQPASAASASVKTTCASARRPPRPSAPTRFWIAL